MARGQNPARYLAPLALALFALIFIVILISSGVLGGGSSPPGSSSGSEQSSGSSQGSNGAAPATTTTERRIYVVKPGDSLVGIAEKTGVSVAQLQQLNPDVDPQALISGQRLKLR